MLIKIEIFIFTLTQKIILVLFYIVVRFCHVYCVNYSKHILCGTNEQLYLNNYESKTNELMVQGDHLWFSTYFIGSPRCLP